MLEKLGFQSLVEQTVTSKRIPRAMDLYRFVLGIVLGLYIGFPRLNQLRFMARDPILTGILKVTNSAGTRAPAGAAEDQRRKWPPASLPILPFEERTAAWRPPELEHLRFRVARFHASVCTVEFGC